MPFILRTPQATITVGDKSTSRLLDGIGVNWCDAFGMGGDRGMGQINMPLTTPCIPTLDDDRSWALLLEELTLLKVGCVRFLLPPDGFITKRGTMDFDCDHFERLERLNAWAGANGASIVLDTMYVPRHMQVKGEESSSGWAVDNRAAANPRQFAENFAGPLLDYCLSERGWTQIRYYSPVNQPLYGDIYSHPRMDPYRAFAELLTALRQELLARDLVPQRLSMLGPGSPGVQDWPIPDFHSRGLDLDPLLDAYDQHEYFARFDGTAPNANGLSVPMTELIEHHLAPHVAYARTKGKPFLITELGHFYYGASNGDPNGPATHEAFMLDAEFALRAINTGVSGLMRWSFLNPGDINGRWQLLDTADGSLRRESHSFYGYATLVRYARPHSDVLQVQTESSFHPWPHVYACALRKMPQGDVTLLVSNNHDNEQVEVTIKLPPLFRSKKINIIRTDRILKHHKAAEIRRDPRGGPIVDKIPPRSLNVYTSLEHDALERP